MKRVDEYQKKVKQLIKQDLNNNYETEIEKVIEKPKHEMPTTKTRTSTDYLS